MKKALRTLLIWVVVLGALGAGVQFGLRPLLRHPPLQVKTVVVERGSVRDVVTSSTAGEVVVEKHAVVTSEVAGRVVQVRHARQHGLPSAIGELAACPTQPY